MSNENKHIYRSMSKILEHKITLKFQSMLDRYENIH